jgi:hypothetical protein
MKKTIYRACDGYTGKWSCWAERREHAKAYQDNQGYGGPKIVSTKVDTDKARVLDAVGMSWRAFAVELGYDEEQAVEWRCTGYGWLHEVIENERDVQRRLSASYDWVRHDNESFPANCITWVKTQV